MTHSAHPYDVKHTVTQTADRVLIHDTEIDPTRAFAKTVRIDPETLEFADAADEQAFATLPSGAHVHVTFAPIPGTPAIIREIIRESVVPVEDLEVTEHCNTVFYGVKGATEKALIAEAEKRGETFSHINVKPQRLPSEVESVSGKDRHLQIIVPVDEKGFPLFEEIDSAPEVYTSRMEARAALCDAVDAARDAGELTRLGVIGVSLRESGKVAVTGETKPWTPNSRHKRLTVETVNYAFGEGSSITEGVLVKK